MKRFLVLVFSLIVIFGGSSLLFSSKLNNSFADESQNEKTISSKDEFVNVLKADENYDNSDVVIKLTASIDLKDQDLKEVFKADREFKGVFDGNGFTISNLTLHSANNFYGIFPKTNGATIKNLKITGGVKFEHDGDVVVNDVTAGVVAGLAKDTQFENIELDNSVIKEVEEEVENEAGEQAEEVKVENLSMQVTSNLNFGAIAGEINNSSTYEKTSIKNCVNFYDIAIEANRETNVLVGGFAGKITNCYILNTINYGNISFKYTAQNEEQKQNPISIGGIVGAIYGSPTQVRNSCFLGGITEENATNLTFRKGAIVGEGKSSLTSASNINFDYYTDKNLSPSGDNFLNYSDKIKQVDIINREFLEKNSDPAKEAFDFDKTWNVLNSQFHLQIFQEFDFMLNQQIDNNQTLQSASFDENGTSNKKTVKYGNKISIYLQIKEEYYKYYVLSRVQRVQQGVDNTELDKKLYTIKEETDTEQESGIIYVKGYQIDIEVNALTSGTYSFVLEPKEYRCVIAISEEAKVNKDGGILVDNGSSPRYEDFELTFYSDSNAKKITAVGQGIYAFDHWYLYYKNQDGTFSGEPVGEFADVNSQTLNIKFGIAPYDREFKVVAYFTNEGAIKVDFSQFQQMTSLKSIKFSGVEYAGEPILVSKNATQIPLDITISKGFKLDVDEFTKAIKTLYGEENSTNALITSSPTLDENENTVYHFAINMKNIEEIQNNSLSFSFLIVEDKSGGVDPLLWLYITIPAVVVLVAVIVLIILLRRRKARKKAANDVVTKAKPKKVSYKDLY